MPLSPRCWPGTVSWTCVDNSVLLTKNDFTEHQYQTRPFWTMTQTKPRPVHNLCVDTDKTQNCLNHKMTNIPGCYFFINYAFSLH